MDFLILLLLTLHQTRAAENVFQLRGAYSLRESASRGDGTGITSGPCLSVNSAHAYVDLINQMNAGKGFEVYSNIRNETSYFQLNYTFKTYLHTLRGFVPRGLASRGIEREYVGVCGRRFYHWQLGGMLRSGNDRAGGAGDEDEQIVLHE